MPELLCEKLIAGGLGLCRTDSGVVFVEGLLPGEHGECTLSGKRGGVAIYSTTKRVSTSPHRVEPICRHFGICGGCDWQDLNYLEQVKAKEGIFIENLRRLGGVQAPPKVEVFTGPDISYRIRAQVKVDSRLGVVGFCRSGSRDVVAIDSCPLLTDGLNKILAQPQKLLESLGDYRQISLLETTSATLSSPPISGLSQFEGEHSVGDYKISLRGDSFFQSNRYLTQSLAQWRSGEIGCGHLLDLFGGTGLFSLFHGRHFSKTTLVEQSVSMAKEAGVNMAKASIPNPRAIGQSAEKFFAEQRSGSYNTVIVDPPRPGLSKEVRQGLKKLNPETILYISCNPATQARDIGYFIRDCGYSLESAALFDLYPHTHHIETGLVLKKL